MGARHGVTRRKFLAGTLAGTAGLLIGQAVAGALGPRSSMFRVARLQPAGSPPLSRPGAERRLVWEVLKRTSVAGDLEELVIAPESPELFEQPFVMWAGEEGAPPLSDAALGRLGRFLRFGGFLLADNCGGPEGSAFDASFRATMARLFPRQRLRPLAADHTIYRSFYLLDRPYGRTTNKSYLETIDQDGRTLVVYSQNDLPGAWARDPLGNWLYSVTPGGEHQREMAVRLGVNLVMYALCLDYKRDQVHVETLMRRRRWRPRQED